MDGMLISSAIISGVENLKARLARKCVIKDGAARRILEMKIFRNWKNRKFWIAQMSFDMQDAELVGTLFFF